MANNKKILKLIDIGEKKYKVPLPKRLRIQNNRPTKIKVAFRDGEHHYYPRKYTFGKDVALSCDELRSIANELDRLNDAVVSGDEQ